MLLNLYENNHSCNEILSAIAMSYTEDTLFYCTLPHYFYVIFCNVPWALEGII